MKFQRICAHHIHQTEYPHISFQGCFNIVYLQTLTLEELQRDTEGCLATTSQAMPGCMCMCTCLHIVCVRVCVFCVVDCAE